MLLKEKEKDVANEKYRIAATAEKVRGMIFSVGSAGCVGLQRQAWTVLLQTVKRVQLG